MIAHNCTPSDDLAAPATHHDHHGTTPLLRHRIYRAAASPDLCSYPSAGDWTKHKVEKKFGFATDMQHFK